MSSKPNIEQEDMCIINKSVLTQLQIYAGYFAVLLALSCSPVSAEWILSAPPRESVEKGKINYDPIAKYLSQVLNEKVVYQHPGNWTNYSLNMRGGKYDIVFDGPHLTAWRIKNVGHIPVVRLDGALTFYVLAKKNDTSAKTMRSIVGRPLCGLSSPNLGTVSAFAMYNNPIIYPNIKIIKGGMPKVMKLFMEGKCKYAVVRDKLFKKLSAEKKNLINIIGKSPSMPNQSISITSKISKEKRNAITKALISKEGALASIELLKRFSKKKKYFISTNKKEFKNFERLLEGVVWGW